MMRDIKPIFDFLTPNTHLGGGLGQGRLRIWLTAFECQNLVQPVLGGGIGRVKMHGLRHVDRGKTLVGLVAVQLALTCR